MKIIEPEFGSDSFSCPHCNVSAQQNWINNHQAGSYINDVIANVYYSYRRELQDYKQQAIEQFTQELKPYINNSLFKFLPSDFSISECSHCEKITLWVNRQIVYPLRTTLPPPNSDLNDEIKSLYLEASSILPLSPKGATALLRLALQLLMKQVGKKGENINNDIKELVAEGLSVKIQQALDLLRVVGNNAVHPGQINLDDDNGIATKIFHILNYIADELITKPKELEFLYVDLIPDGIKQSIINRDK